MIISVASGKGGTGKTTIATSLAQSIDADVQILDCDVEEPNAHLFIRPEILDEREVTVPVPVVDEDMCSRCGRCAEICEFKAIVVIGETVLTFPELCHGCGGCLEVCPENAITEGKRQVGVLETGSKDGMEFVHGRLRVGEAMSPPLIRKVREKGNPQRTIIIDAPPGTSCPVIASIKGTDFVLLVTEPTPFGLHDLKLAVEAVKILGIPRGLVINRADIGDNNVKEYAEQEGIPILMEIPFEREIAEAYSTGITIVEAKPEWAGRFRELYQNIQKISEESLSNAEAFSHKKSGVN